MKILTDKKLLKLWGQAVIEKAGYKCEYPDCDVIFHQLHPHHLYDKRTVTMRYSLENGIALCPTHHKLSSFAAHKDPDFKDILTATGVRTEELFDRLREERSRKQDNTQQWKDECYQKLKVYL